MARIVRLEDQKPLTIDPGELQETVSICRCGLSAQWPYCDGSHQATRQEEDGKLYGYRRETPQGPLLREELPAGSHSVDPRPGDK